MNNDDPIVVTLAAITGMGVVCIIATVIMVVGLLLR